VVALTVDLADFVKSTARQDKGLYYRLSIDQRPVYSDNFQADNSYVSLRNKDTRHMSYLHELGMAVEIGALKKEYQKPLVQAAWRFLGLAVIALVVAVFVAARTGQRIARPIVELCGRVQRTSLAEGARCSPLGTGDELEELALAFDLRNGQLLQVQKELRANNEALKEEIFRRQILEELLQKAHDNLEKRVEERTQELHASQESLTRAQAIAHLGNWDWQVGEDRLWWSDEIYRIFGLEPQAFAANYEAFLAAVHPADCEMVTQVVERAREKGAPFALEHRIILPSGEERVVLEQGEVVCDEEGVALRMVGTVLDISVQKELEMLLVKEEERLSSLLALSQRSWSSQEELVEFALEEAVSLTGSEVGYFHLVDESQKEIELYVWSKKTRALCTIAEPLSHYPLAAAGVWADSIRQGQAVIHNDYQALAAKKGLPEGHFPLRRHLGVPVFDGEAIVAVVGVGTSTQEYHADSVRQLTLYMNSMWQVLKRKRMEEELQRKNANLAVLYRVTEAVNKSVDLQETLVDILEVVTTLDFVKVERRGVLFLVNLVIQPPFVTALPLITNVSILPPVSAAWRPRAARLSSQKIPPRTRGTPSTIRNCLTMVMSFSPSRPKKS
jgi:PAS domain-containing protein